MFQGGSSGAVKDWLRWGLLRSTITAADTLLEIILSVTLLLWYSDCFLWIFSIFTTRFLELEDFSESFIDNGYDDLETVTLIPIPIWSQYYLCSYYLVNQVCPVSQLHDRLKFFCFGNSKNSTRWSVRIRTRPGEADWKRWSGGNRGSWNRSTELLTWKVHILYIHAWVYLHTFILSYFAYLHTFILSYFRWWPPSPSTTSPPRSSSTTPTLLIMEVHQANLWSTPSPISTLSSRKITSPK